MIDVDLIVKADYVVKMDADLGVVKNGAIAVKDGKIAGVGAEGDILKKFSSGKTAGGSGFVAFPGLVNTHTHAAMVYFRGLGDDLPLKSWLEDHIWPAENRWLSEEFVEDAVILACAEMLKAGITIFNDMYFHGDAVSAAAKKMGMRAMVGAGIVDFPTRTANTPAEYFSNAEKFINRWKGDDLIIPAIAPHSPYACSPRTIRTAREMADRYGVALHTHLSETKWENEEVMKRHGQTPITLMEANGFFEGKTIAAHCVWPSDAEIGILASRGVHVSHCIESNLKLASGIAPIAKMLASGVKVTFGTDGAASNNDLNILSEMSTAAKVHKAVSADPTALGARQVFLMGTRWAAEALGLGDLCGSIEEGKSADIVIADLNRPHLAPLYDIYSQIVYSMDAGDVHTVIVRGDLLVEHGRLAAADESDIIETARRWGKKIRG